MAISGDGSAASRWRAVRTPYQPLSISRKMNRPKPAGQDGRGTVEVDGQLLPGEVRSYRDVEIFVV